MQQVNLYLPELRPQREWLDARLATVITVAFIGLMLVLQLVTHVRANNLEHEVAQQQQLVADLQTRVDQLKRTSGSAGRPALDDTIAQLEAAIANREKVGRILSGQNVGDAHGFHANMLSLARESRSDLALDRFTFSRGGNYVEMHGQARSAEAVPLYLQRLKQDPAFSQARFGLLSVSSESDAPSLEFSLGYDNVYAQESAGGKQ